MIDRQARDLPLDAHLHTDLSPDSDVPIDAFAEQAVERGIPEIAITDHVDFEPGAPAFAFTTFEDRERIVRDAAERWGPQGVQIHAASLRGASCSLRAAPVGSVRDRCSAGRPRDRHR